MKIGYFAVDDSGKIVAMNSEAIKFAEKNIGKVTWYASGKLERDDIIIRLQRGNLSICKNENKDYSYLEKKAGPDNEIIDIIYADERVKVSYENYEIKITVGKQFIVFKDYNMEDEEVAVIADKRGIKYYARNDNAVNEILNGSAYRSHIDENIEINAYDFFGEIISKKLSELNDIGMKAIVDCGGTAVFIEKIDHGNFVENCSVYSIGSEEMFLESIKSETEKYNALYKKRSINVNFNGINCDARLHGDDDKTKALNEKLEKVCKKDATIVLTGESGTGKTYLAKQIHKNSRRSDGPFVAVNCASISYNLIESELFGYEEGAFTGASRGGKIGYFEMAKGGTLFLDEITELPLNLQGKLLEVLQSGEFYKVGGIEKKIANVRLIVATNMNLENLVKEKKFREDLYYRINVFPIHLPPLRERLDNLYGIIEDILPSIYKRLDIEPLMISNGAMDKLKNYTWPGNIRELENVLEKAAVMADDVLVREEDIVIAGWLNAGVTSISLRKRLEDYEKEIIQDAMKKFSGNRRKVAEHLGLSKTNLFEKIHKYEIEEKYD